MSCTSIDQLMTSIRFDLYEYEGNSVFKVVQNWHAFCVTSMHYV